MATKAKKTKAKATKGKRKSKIKLSTADANLVRRKLKEIRAIGDRYRRK